MKKICWIFFIFLVFGGCSVERKPDCLGRTSLTLASLKLAEVFDAECFLSTEFGECQVLLSAPKGKDGLEGICEISKEIQIHLRIAGRQFTLKAERFLEKVSLEIQSSTPEPVRFRFDKRFVKQATYYSETNQICFINQGGYFLGE